MRRPAKKLLTLVLTGALYPAARWWLLRWGAEVSEVDAQLPGDELIGNPTIVTTRAITIHASPEAIWPWLVQMGQDRGGLYSYDWLENLCGLRFHNADRIVPEWQHLDVGDQIRAAPATAGPEAGFTVVAIDACRSIVTAIGDPSRVLVEAKAGSLSQGGTWVFVLRPLDERRTRLIVRLRANFGMPHVAEWLAARVLEPIHFVMERKQLLGIRRRVTGD